MLSSKKNKLIFILFFFIEIVVAQISPSVNITINDGLPSNDIKCFYKDSRGLLWIGTEAGLCCYDGSVLKIFNETSGLKYDSVWSILEDEKKNLWLSLYGHGLAKYDGKKFVYYNEKDGLVNNAIRKIHYSKKYRCLILATEKGLGLFDGKNFKSLFQNTSWGSFQVVGIEETSENIYITASYSNVFNLIIDKDIQKSRLEKVFTPIISYSSFISDNTYLSGGANRFLFVRNLKTNKENTIPTPIIWDFAKDDDNNIYCASWNVTDPKGGLFKYHNGKLTDITKQANITSTMLWCLLYDKETKQLWVGSGDKGIYRVDLSKQINFLKPSFFGLKELEIQELYNDANNTTWIGAKDNILLLHKDLKYTLFDKANIWNKILNYLQKKGVNTKTDKDYKKFYTRSNFTSFNIVPDNEGNIWVNTTIGTFCFDKNYKILFHKFLDGGHLVFDEKDQAYYGLMYSDIKFMSNKFDWTQNTLFSTKDSSIPRSIMKIVKDGNRIWFASHQKGLFLLHNNKFQSLKFNENFIKDLIINEYGQLVIGTNSGKVYIAKWNGTGLDILHIYKPYKELYGTSISFVEHSKNTYFIGTNKGINIVQNNKFIKLINKSEGLTDIQFNDCIKDKYGNLLIATNDGLIQLNVTEVLKSNESNKKPINISTIKVNGELFTNSNIAWNTYNHNELKLDYNHNDVEIVFSANTIFNADKNVYRYKVIGLSNNWNNFESNNKIQLLGIPNGKYKLVIEGKNIGTGNFFQTKILHITITPPFWKTWWFLLSCFILLLIFAYLIYLNRVRLIKKEEKAKYEIQKRLAETKMEALQSQMNPHFIFNAMNSIQNYIIDNNTDDALMYMGEFSKIIRQTLNNSSVQRIALADEIEYLKSYITLENMRFKNQVVFELLVDEELDLFEIEIPPMLLQPFIENVFVHAFDNKSVHPKLTVSFKQKDNYLLCKIIDNGKGMLSGNLSKLHTSKGITLVKERIALFQENNEHSIDISSKPNKGTTVVLKLQIE